MSIILHNQQLRLQRLCEQGQARVERELIATFLLVPKVPLEKEWAMGTWALAEKWLIVQASVTLTNGYNMRTFPVLLKDWY